MPKPSPQPVEKLLYDKRSAAFALSVSVRTIDNMILANEIRGVSKCGRKVLIPIAEIKRIAKRSQLREVSSGSN